MNRASRLPPLAAAQIPAGANISNTTQRTGSARSQKYSCWRKANALLLGISTFQIVNQHFFAINRSQLAGAALISCTVRSVQYFEIAIGSVSGFLPCASIAASYSSRAQTSTESW